MDSDDLQGACIEQHELEASLDTITITAYLIIHLYVTFCLPSGLRRPRVHTEIYHTHNRYLTVGLGDALELVLLADRVRLLRVGGGGGDQLVGEALSDGLDRTKGGLAGLRSRERKTEETRT